jgi:hypothetical protein
MYAWLASKQLSAVQVVSGIYSLRDPSMTLHRAFLNNNSVLSEQEFTEIETFMAEVIEEMLNPEIPLKSVPDYQFSLF